MACSRLCRCVDIHGLTDYGLRFPIGNRQRCLICNALSNEDMCAACAQVQEVAYDLLTRTVDTIEGRRILRHARFYLKNRIHYSDCVFGSLEEQEITNLVTVRYREYGPAFVLRTQIKDGR